MRKYTTKDTVLLQEAYSVQLLREQAPDMTLEDVQNQLHTMNESQLEYITTVLNRVIEEAGMFSNLWRGAKGAASQVKQNVANVGTGIANVGRGVASAAKQVGQNVKNIAATGQTAGKSIKLLANAEEAVNELVDILNQAVQLGIYGKGRSQNFMNLPLKNVINSIMDAKTTAEGNAQAATSGSYGGYGAGVRSAYQQGKARGPAPAGAPAGAPATA